MTYCQAFYYTNEKGKCEKNFFCNYLSGLPLSTHRPVTTKNMGESTTPLATKKNKACLA